MYWNSLCFQSICTSLATLFVVSSWSALCQLLHDIYPFASSLMQQYHLQGSESRSVSIPIQCQDFLLRPMTKVQILMFCVSFSSSYACLYYKDSTKTTWLWVISALARVMILFWIGSSESLPSSWRYIYVDMWPDSTLCLWLNDTAGSSFGGLQLKRVFIIFENVRIAQGKSVRFSNRIWNLILVDINL